MGKSKQQQQPKVKGNLKPASSSRAAEFTSGQAPLSFANLGGFSQFATGLASVQRPATPGSDGDTLDIDPELSVILKRVNKRDSITKLKALEDLNTYLNAHRAAIQAILPTWVSVYNKLVLEIDRRVRLVANSIHQLVTIEAKKKLAPHLKEFIGAWVLAMYDQSKDVANQATAAFEAVFAEDKRQGVIVFCQKDILEYCSVMLLVKTVETLSDSRYVSPEDMAAKYARVMASSLYSLSYLICTLSKEDRAKCTDDFDVLFDSPQLWKFALHNSPVIRRAMYYFIKNLCLHWPDVLQSRLELVCTDFFASVFADKDASVHSEMWDAVLLMTKKFPDAWIIVTSKKKSPLSKLNNFLRSGLNGSPAIAYPSVIALLANLPTQLKNSPNFFKDVFTNFWKGLSSNVIDQSNSHELVNAYAECAVYFIITKSTTDREVTDYLVNVAIYDALETCFIQSKTTASAHDKLNAQCEICLARHLAVLIKSNADIPMGSLWSKLETLCVQIIIDCNAPAGAQVDVPAFCRQIGTLLPAIHQQLEERKTSFNAGDSKYSPFIGLSKHLFKAALDSALIHKGHATSLLYLIQSLLRSYTADLIEELDVIGSSKKMLSLLPDVDIPSLSYFVSAYVTLLSNSTDATTKECLWENIVIQLCEWTSSDETMRRMTALNLLLEKIDSQSLQIDYCSPRFDELVHLCSSTLISHNDQHLSRSVIEAVFVKIISLHLRVNLLSEESFKILLDSLVSILKKFNQRHYSNNNDNDAEDSSHASEDLVNYTTKSTLSIFLALLERDKTATKIMSHPLLSDLPNQVFDAMFAKQHVDSITTAENHSAIDESVANDIQLVSEMLWNNMVSIINSTGVSCEVQTQFKQGVLQHVRSSIIDVNCVASPLESIHRATRLLSTLYTDTTTSDYQAAVTSMVGRSSTWSEMYAIFQDKRSLEYLGSSVTDRYAGMDFQPLWEDKDELFPIQYDIYGLSSLTRWALFVTSFIQDHVGVASFFNPNTADSVCDRDSLVRLWMIIALECKQGLGMVGLTRLWRSPSSTPSAATALPGDALVVGVSKFVEQASSIFEMWFKSMMNTVTGSRANLCTCLYDGIRSGNSNNAANESGERLLQFVFACLKQERYSDAYYASFIQLLMDRLVMECHWTEKDIEKWLPLLKAEATELSPLTKAALITSFKNTIGETSAFRYLSSDLANKLSGANSLQVFEDRPDALQWLILLNASSLEFGSIAIPPQRLLYMISTIKTWFKQDDDDHLEVVKKSRVHMQLAILFDNVSGSIQEVSGSHWHLFLDRVYEWISYNDADEYDGLPVMYYALRLLSTLLVMVEEGNDDIEEALHEHWSDIGVALWSCFIKEKDIPLPVSQPRQRYQELLADILAKVPEKILHDIIKFNDVGHLLNSTNDALQKRAFFILKWLVREQASALSVQLEFTEDADDEHITKRIERDLFQRLMKAPDLFTWDTSVIEEKTLHDVFGYLISWLLMFEHFNDITFRLKQEYTAELKEADSMDILLPFLFKILCVGGGQGVTPFDLSPWDCSTYDLEGFDITVDTSYSLLAGHLYYQTLRHIPSLARTWWMNHRQRQLVIAVERYTEQHFSRLLINHEMDLVNRPDIKQPLEENDNEFKVKTLKATNEVCATYNVDEQEMQISIKLPSNYPLQQIQVEGVQKVGVSDKQWRGWMYAIAAVIGSQNGNLVDALTVFKRNTNLHFDGVGDCVICYSIISVQDRSIPTKQCRTCKNKFHASCLYKWFRSSNSASCPLCRTVF